MKKNLFVMMMLLFVGVFMSCKKDPVEDPNGNNNNNTVTEPTIPSGLSFTNKSYSDLVELSWTGVADSFEVNITNTKTQEVSTVKSKETKCNFTSADGGTYSWVVKSFLNGKSSAWSEKGTDFTVRSINVTFDGRVMANNFVSAALISNPNTGVSYVGVYMYEESTRLPVLEFVLPIPTSASKKIDLRSYNEAFLLQYYEKNIIEYNDSMKIGDWVGMEDKNGTIELLSYDLNTKEISFTLSTELTSTYDIFEEISPRARKLLKASFKNIKLATEQSSKAPQLRSVSSKFPKLVRR